MYESHERLRNRLEARQDRRGGRLARLFPLLLGLLLGAGLGLYVGWVAWPIEFSDADPSFLNQRYRQDYTLMIAAAYEMDGDLAGARRRLGSVAAEDVDAWLLSLTVDQILNGGNEHEIRQLVALAGDLGLSSPLMEPYRSDK